VGNSNCHAGSIPLVYNPTMTHITPQFHVIFDESFTMATGDISTTHSSYFDKLFGSTANWMYHDAFTETPYNFSSFWSGDSSPLNTDDTHPHKRRKLTADTNTATNVPFRGSLPAMLQAHSSQSCVTPLQGSLSTMANAPSLETLHECYNTVPEALKG
jgi:hypothetical protein